MRKDVSKNNCDDLVVRRDNVIVGGDMNFILRHVELWGGYGSMDPLVYFLLQKIEEQWLCDLEPLILKPMWRNNKLGNESIVKYFIGSL